MRPQIFGIKDPLVLKTDTQKTEKNLTKQFLLIKRVQAHIQSSWEDTWAQSGQQWLLLISLAQLYLLLTWDLSRSKVHNLFQFAKKLKGWVRACNLAGSKGLYQNLEEETGTLFIQCKSPTMMTWGILSNLRVWPILWQERSFFLHLGVVLLNHMADLYLFF
jgi:hypothetical protein